MSEPAWAALAVVVAAAIALTGTLLSRKPNTTLATAQAHNEDAETLEITDRIAREWIIELRAEVGRLNDRLDAEVAVRLEQDRHIEVLEAWINARKPPPPPIRPRFT
jgi:hypothetical protein